MNIEEKKQAVLGERMLVKQDSGTEKFPVVDMDGNVGIADVTTLIDYILNGDNEGIDINAADCDVDGVVGIADVTTLIDYILSHIW